MCEKDSHSSNWIKWALNEYSIIKNKRNIATLTYILQYQCFFTTKFLKPVSHLHFVRYPSLFVEMLLNCVVISPAHVLSTPLIVTS